MTSHSDMEFATNAGAEIERRTLQGFTLQLLTIGLLVVTMVGWAHWAMVIEVVVGVGKVIPSSQLQVVQSLEGGIVQEFFVTEGQSVKKGQDLVRIDDTGFASRLGEISKRRAALGAEIARLDAEAAGSEEVEFDAKLRDEAPAAIALEIAAFRARRSKLENETSVLRQVLLQRQQEVSELEARRERALSTLTPLRRELSLNRSLAQRGIIAEVEVLRLERLLAELIGDLKIVEAALPRTATAIIEAQSRLDSVRTGFVANVRERLAAAQGDASVIDESIKGARDRVDRALLRSPVNGVVNKLTVTTLGAVVQPGQSVIEIVPLDDTLLVETRVRPQDVAFIRPGQVANVKLTAYDYLVYGTLPGEVERIGADTITDPRGDTFYRVVVRTARNWLGTADNRLIVIPGMVANVDIESGRKTVLDYLLKPVLRVRHEAFRER